MEQEQSQLSFLLEGCDIPFDENMYKRINYLLMNKYNVTKDDFKQLMDLNLCQTYKNRILEMVLEYYYLSDEDLNKYLFSIPFKYIESNNLTLTRKQLIDKINHCIYFKRIDANINKILENDLDLLHDICQIYIKKQNTVLLRQYPEMSDLVKYYINIYCKKID